MHIFHSQSVPSMCFSGHMPRVIPVWPHGLSSHTKCHTALLHWSGSSASPEQRNVTSLAASPAIGPWSARQASDWSGSEWASETWTILCRDSLWGWKWPARVPGPALPGWCGARRAAMAGSWQCGIIHCLDHSTLQPVTQELIKQQWMDTQEPRE